MKQILLTVILLFVLGGCAQKRHYYVLSAPHQITATDHRIEQVIGVEDLQVPEYLHEGRIALLQKNNRVIYLNDALWAVDMQKDLTDALIFDLQKSLPGSVIVHYPWESAGRDVDLVVRVKITRFIASQNEVYLDAVVRVGDHDKILSFKEPIESMQADNIVEGMKRAFFRLERAVTTLLDDIALSQKKQR